MSNAFILVLVAVCFSVTGEILLKAGMDRAGIFSLAAIATMVPKMLRIWQLWAGFGSISIGAVFWLSAISRVDLSWAYPMLAMGYVLTLIFARTVLHEPVSLMRWIGSLVIVLGVYLVSRS